MESVSTSVTSIVAVECKKKNDNSNLTDKFIYFTVHPPDKGIIFNKKNLSWISYLTFRVFCTQRAQSL